MFEETTQDFQTVTAQGQLICRIADFEKAAAALDFTVNLRNGAYVDQPMEKLSKRMVKLAQVLVKSILAGAAGIAKFYGIPAPAELSHPIDRSASVRFYTVREPYPSASTGADMVFGQITAKTPLQIESHMPENGVIFSDGMEQDFLQFNSGSIVTIGIADQKGYLVA